MGLPAEAGTLTNTAMVLLDQSDPNLLNNIATATVVATCNPFSVSPFGALPTATAGSGYSQQFTAAGAAGLLSWSATSIPPALTLDPVSGLLSGTPVAARTSYFAVTATEQNGCAATSNLSLTAISPPGQLNGNVWAWGDNGRGDFGTGTFASSTTPVEAVNLLGITAISASGSSFFNLALRSDGTVWSWGTVGAQGTNGGFSGSPTPAQISNLSGVTAIAAGGTFDMALKGDGTVWTWGGNSDGELGNGTITPGASGVLGQVVNLSGVVAISAGISHALALKNDGTVWAWGYNFWGQLGNGAFTDSGVPVQVLNLSGVIAISAGAYHSLALKSDGTVWAWGDNEYGEVGDGQINSTGTNPSVSNQVNTPTQVINLSGVTSVAGGPFFSLALRNDGTVWGWGSDGLGELGDGIAAPARPAPVQAGVMAVKTIATGYHDSLAIKTDGTLWAWGDNSYGQFGNGTISAPGTAIPTPTQISNVSGVQAIAGSSTFPAYTLALIPAASSPGFISANNANSQVGQTVAFTVNAVGLPTPRITQTGPLPTGLTFVDNGNGTGTLSGTPATGTAGTYDVTFTAQNGVTPDATQNFVLTILPASTTTSLTAAPNPVNAGQTDTLTAVVAAAPPAPGTPSGTVAFFDGGAPLVCSGGNQTLSTGQATCQYAFNTQGSHVLSASYTGSSDFASSSGSITLTVSAPLPPPAVQVTDNETIHVTDTEAFADVFDQETVHETDAVTVTPLINVAAPVVSFSAGSLGFNGQSGTQTITVSDIGQASLTLASTTISGSPQFSVAQIACSNGATSFSTTLPSGGACVLTITYAVSATPSNDNATLIFTDNAGLSDLQTTGSAPNYMQSVALSGAGASTAPPPPPPAVIPVMDNETIHLTDTESFPDVFDAEKISVADQVQVIPCDFTIAANSPLSISVGSFGSTPVTITSVAGCSLQVALAASTPPSGVAFSFSSNSVTTSSGGAAASTVTVNVGPSVAPTTFAFTVTGSAGPSHSASVSVNVNSTTVGIIGVVQSLLNAGAIDYSSGIANALTSKLSATQSAINAGTIQTAINILGAFKNQVQAQTGKHILTSITISGVTFNPVNVLLADAQGLIDSLRVGAIANPINGYVLSASGGVSGTIVSILDSNGNTVATAATDITGFYYFPTTGVLTLGANYTIEPTSLTGFTTSTPATQTFTWSGSAMSFNFSLN